MSAAVHTRGSPAAATRRRVRVGVTGHTREYGTVKEQRVMSATANPRCLPLTMSTSVLPELVCASGVMVQVVAVTSISASDCMRQLAVGEELYVRWSVR